MKDASTRVKFASKVGSKVGLWQPVPKKKENRDAELLEEQKCKMLAGEGHN